MQKFTKTAIILTTSITLLITFMIPVTYMTPAHASHGTLKTFQSGDIQYRCHSNLQDINYERIIPCKEFGKAASTWSAAISNLDITNASTNAEITVFSGSFNDKTQAEAVPYTNSKYADHATIQFSTKYGWGDNTYIWHIFRYDFQTVSLHELGHVLGLDHDANSPLMKNSIGFTDTQRTIPVHDKNAVQEKFGDE